MTPYASPPTGAGPSRTPVVFDERTGDLRIGEHGRHVADPAQPEQVYGAYLSLLYDVRRAKPGERLPLRAADLEALLLLVGDDPDTIESRLVDLMGCTPAEAGVLGRLLLRQRRATATLGIAALTLAGAGVVTQLGGDGAGAPVAIEQSVEQSVAAVPSPVLSAPVAVGPVAVLPVSPVSPAPAPTVVSVAAAPVVVGPQVPEPVAVAAAPAAPAPVVVEAPADPVVVEAPPAPAAPVEVAAEDRYVMPLVETPVLDAPPPVFVPESGIGEAISLEPEVLEPISGIGGSEDHAHEEISGVGGSGDHEAPVEVEQPATEVVEPEPVPLPTIEIVEPSEPAAEQVPSEPQG